MDAIELKLLARVILPWIANYICLKPHETAQRHGMMMPQKQLPLEPWSGENFIKTLLMTSSVHN